jgi:DNA helicase II / ATP-dependent DNA helicase PcrA
VLRQRHADGGGEESVNLLSYHRAKGLEFEAVFLPRLERNELPSRLARTEGAVAEERRLLYVGMTRAKRHLFLTWAGRPSPFLEELGVRASRPEQPKPNEDELPPVYRALKAWRLTRARLDGVPAYVVFHDRTLAEIATRRPGTAAELAGVAGVGPAKLERYGSEVLQTLERSLLSSTS